jgi:hypothetical protein
VYDVAARHKFPTLKSDASINERNKTVWLGKKVKFTFEQAMKAQRGKVV